MKSKISQRSAKQTRARLTKLVETLADPMAWNWMSSVKSDRDSADKVLGLMAQLGLITHRQHKLGGNIWIVDGKRFGRTKD